MTNAGRAGILAGSIIAVDQLTKALLRSGVERGERKDVLPGVDFVHTHNDGIAWGFFSGGGSGIIVPAATILAVGVLLWWFWTFREKPWVWLPVGMILGGAVGNVIDRIVEGAVTDFLDIPVFPPFNVADMSITFGLLAALWGFDWVLDDEKKKQAEDDEQRAADGAA